MRLSRYLHDGRLVGTICNGAVWQEFIWLDPDSLPVSNPEFLFHVEGYKQTGALYWPDICNVRSAKWEAWDLFGLTPPPRDHYPDIPPERVNLLLDQCDAAVPLEIEPAQFVMNKKMVWKALMLMAFVSKNHEYFYTRMVWGDKSPALQFNATNTPFYLAARDCIVVGRAMNQANGHVHFTASTWGIRHPLRQHEVFILHRSGAKFNNALEYVTPTGFANRAWQYQAKRGPMDPKTFAACSALPSEIKVTPYQLHCIGFDNMMSTDIEPVPQQV